MITTYNELQTWSPRVKDNPEADLDEITFKLNLPRMEAIRNRDIWLQRQGVAFKN